MTELVEKAVTSAPNAMESDLSNAVVSKEEELRVVREEVEIAKMKLAMIAKSQEEMGDTRNRGGDKLRGERIEEIVTRILTTMESQKTFGCCRDEAVGQAT